MKLYSRRQIIFLAVIFSIVTGISCFFLGTYSGKTQTPSENTASVTDTVFQESADSEEPVQHQPVITAASDTKYSQSESQNIIVHAGRSAKYFRLRPLQRSRRKHKHAGYGG